MKVGGSAVLAILLFCFSACARRVVIDPERVPQYNNAEWRITSTPSSKASGDTVISVPR
jgi:hypothetical protein